MFIECSSVVFVVEESHCVCVINDVIVGNVYKCHYPYKTPQTARGAKHTAVYDRVAKQGAYFRAVSNLIDY